MIGYGSLITASNTGLVTMGKTAILGLGLVFLCVFYLLPLLLKPVQKESRFF
jgi:predicted exporter